MVRRAEKASAKHKKQKTRRLLVIGTCGLLIILNGLIVSEISR